MKISLHESAKKHSVTKNSAMTDHETLEERESGGCVLMTGTGIFFTEKLNSRKFKKTSPGRLLSSVPISMGL